MYLCQYKIIYFFNENNSNYFVVTIFSFQYHESVVLNYIKVVVRPTTCNLNLFV